MKKKKPVLDLPILKDVVVPGKEIPISEEPSSVLSDLQLKALQQQIGKIIQTQLEETLKKVSQDTVRKINAHLDKVLPKLLKEMTQVVSNENHEPDEE
ncbi:MAG: hypothetical protein HC877_16235 [Thioploca sp.]|nr:hypothetical protein [Thioploca sp.]